MHALAHLASTSDAVETPSDCVSGYMAWFSRVSHPFLLPRMTDVSDHGMPSTSMPSTVGLALRTDPPQSMVIFKTCHYVQSVIAYKCV